MFNNYLSITSPLDQFEIRNLFSIDAWFLANMNLSITNIGLYMTILAFIAFCFSVLAINDSKIIANSWSLSQITLYSTIPLNIVSNNGSLAQKWLHTKLLGIVKGKTQFFNRICWINNPFIGLYMFTLVTRIIPKILVIYQFTMVIFMIISIFFTLMGMDGLWCLALLYLNNYITSEHYDWSIVNMSSNGGSNGGPSGNEFSNNPNNSSGGGGGGWTPYPFEKRENGEVYDNTITNPSLMEGYDPTGNVPPTNNKQVGVLMKYRFDHSVRPLGYNHWNVAKVFPSESDIDRMARARLLGHILDSRAEIPSAFGQINIRRDNPRWHSVRITSYLINSLLHSNG